VGMAVEMGSKVESIDIQVREAGIDRLIENLLDLFFCKIDIPKLVRSSIGGIKLMQ
jgi:hypothetical protein